MPTIAMPILACVLGKYLMFPAVSRADWIQTGYLLPPVCIRRLVRRCIRLFLRQRIGSLFLTPSAVQQGLEHVDLTLQFVDTTYLLRNQQVA